MKRAAIVLAAGASTRFGSAKQLAEIDGESLLLSTLRKCTEAELHPVIVVLGANTEAIQQAIDLTPFQVVINEGWDEGMGSSLRKGIEALDAADVDGAIVLTCDMPFVSAGHLLALIRKAEQTQRSTASLYAGRRGVPACFVRAEFSSLLQSSGDAGGRALLKDAPYVELADARDIDTVDQLLAARNQYSSDS